MARRLALGGLLVSTLTALAWPGCSFESVPLEGQCGAGEKYCRASQISPDHCVSRGDPNWGCGSDVCVPCSSANANVMGCDMRQACFIISCLPGWGMCGSATSCTTDLTSDIDNCGMCGKTCRLPSGPEWASPHATTRCLDNWCAIDECQPGFANCNGVVSDGCEAQLGTDAHCTGANGCAPCSSGQACVPVPPPIGGYQCQ